MYSMMYAQSAVSAAVLIFYTCIWLPYIELKRAIFRILGSILNQGHLREDETLFEQHASPQLPACRYQDSRSRTSRDSGEEGRGEDDGGGNRQDGCSICLVDFEEDAVVSKLRRCGHVFHLDCIETWVEHRFQFTCPLCRSFIF